MRVLPTVALILALLAPACGGDDKSPAAPTPPQPAQVSGNWTGNFESSNWTAMALRVNITQSGASVTGTWADTTGRDWNGTINGTTDPSSFTGTVTISAPNAAGVGQRCTGTASFSGPASSGTTTLRWTSPGFTGSCTGMPLSVVWNLQRG